MKLFYGWVIVGVAMVVTCVGFGAMFSLGVFLQPMSEAEGWSRTGISTAALLNFLCMGVGSFFWGALSDRLGTRAVVLLGGVLLGLGTVMASRASTLGEFQVYFGVMVGFAAGSLYAPLTATTTRWFTAATSGCSSPRAGSASAPWPSPSRSARPARFRPACRGRAWLTRPGADPLPVTYNDVDLVAEGPSRVILGGSRP